MFFSLWLFAKFLYRIHYKAVFSHDLKWSNFPFLRNSHPALSLTSWNIRSLLLVISQCYCKVQRYMEFSELLIRIYVNLKPLIYLKQNLVYMICRSTTCFLYPYAIEKFRKLRHFDVVIVWMKMAFNFMHLTSLLRTRTHCTYLFIFKIDHMECTPPQSRKIRPGQSPTVKLCYAPLPPTHTLTSISAQNRNNQNKKTFILFVLKGGGGRGI